MTDTAQITLMIFSFAAFFILYYLKLFGFYIDSF